MTDFTYVNANQFSTDPTATYWLDVGSPYFKDVPLNCEADKEELALRIKSGCEYVERYCNRKFSLQGYTGIYTVRQDGCLILANPPVQTIDRICFCNGGWLTVQNTGTYSPGYSTTDGQLRVSQVVSGVRSGTTFLYANNPTLSALVTAINDYGNGWSATVTSGYAEYPSNDLVSFQYGTATTALTILNWQDYQGYLAPNIWPTRGYYMEYDVSTGILDWYFPRGLRLRVDYTAGFDPVPAAIQQVTADLVLGTSRKKSETLGNYTYTLEDIDRLPNSARQILSRFKDRTV